MYKAKKPPAMYTWKWFLLALLLLLVALLQLRSDVASVDAGPGGRRSWIVVSSCVSRDDGDG
jgi:hypothetical protein